MQDIREIMTVCDALPNIDFLMSVTVPADVPSERANHLQMLAMIEHSRGGGGTELKKAMLRAMNLPTQEGVSRTMVVLTDAAYQARGIERRNQRRTAVEHEARLRRAPP